MMPEYMPTFITEGEHFFSYGGLKRIGKNTVTKNKTDFESSFIFLSNNYSTRSVFCRHSITVPFPFLNPPVAKNVTDLGVTILLTGEL